MRVTSHCANHPSREASQRCRSCGKWLCDRCVRPIHGHIFCGLKCRLHDLVSRRRSRFANALKSHVSPFVAAVVVTLVTIAAGTWVATLSMRLSAISNDPSPAPAPMPYAVAEILRDGDTLTIEIQGSPGTTVVLFADGDPIRVVTLDDEGRALVADPGITGRSALELAALAEPPEPISPPPTVTPTDTPNLTATATPPRTSARTTAATARSTATATPTRTTTPTRETALRRPTKPPSDAGEKVLQSRTASRSSPPVLHLVTDAGNRIAVTFDGNASSNGTAELLDLLKELDLKITLFVTGGFIERYPMIVRRAVLEGHEVGIQKVTDHILVTISSILNNNANKKKGQA